jgi:putative transcriptional regulator
VDKKVFTDLVTSLTQAGRIVRSETRVRAIRERTSLSQVEFARLLGVSVKTLQNWEQSRRHPTGPAAALLRIVEKNPKAALLALQD